MSIEIPGSLLFPAVAAYEAGTASLEIQGQIDAQTAVHLTAEIGRLRGLAYAAALGTFDTDEAGIENDERCWTMGPDGVAGVVSRPDILRHGLPIFRIEHKPKTSLRAVRKEGVGGWLAARRVARKLNTLENMLVEVA